MIFNELIGRGFNSVSIYNCVFKVSNWRRFVFQAYKRNRKWGCRHISKYFENCQRLFLASREGNILFHTARSNESNFSLHNNHGSHHSWQTLCVSSHMDLLVGVWWQWHFYWMYQSLWYGHIKAWLLHKSLWEQYSGFQQRYRHFMGILSWYL